MKGGKRLTEDERASIFDWVNRACLDMDWPAYERAGEKRPRILAILERDDEPEYCTCGHAHGMHGADVWACDDCGKPVKGE